MLSDAWIEDPAKSFASFVADVRSDRLCHLPWRRVDHEVGTKACAAPVHASGEVGWSGTVPV